MPISKPMKTTLKSNILQGRKSAWNLEKTYKFLIYGQSGTGKTTLSATFPGRILWLVCSGGEQPEELKSIDTEEYRKKIDAVIIENSQDLLSVIEQLKEENNYATVVLDHLSNFQDLNLKEILGLDGMPIQKSWGMATLQDYGQCALQCKQIMHKLFSVNSNIVIIAQEKTVDNNEDIDGMDSIAPSVGADITKGLKKWLYPACSYIVQTFKSPRYKEEITKVGDKKLVTKIKEVGKVDFCLRTGPHEFYVTKFRCPNKKVPDRIVDPTFQKLEEYL